MKYLSKIILNCFIVIYCVSAAEDIRDRLEKSDIEASTARVHACFMGRFTKESLGEYDKFLGNIGICCFEDHKAYITFRGSQGLQEPWHMVCTRTIKLNDYDILGEVHKNVYETFKKYEPIMLNCIKSYYDKTSILLQDITVEGYSRGTAFAMLAAASIRHNFDFLSLNILNYSPVCIFDQNAANCYNILIGEQNHLNFIAKEDLIPPFFTGQKSSSHMIDALTYPFKGNFASVGTNIVFSATDSTLYAENVRMNKYPNLDPRFYKIMPWFLSAETWNAHMPELYDEMSPICFKR